MAAEDKARGILGKAAGPPKGPFSNTIGYFFMQHPVVSLILIAALIGLALWFYQIVLVVLAAVFIIIALVLSLIAIYNTDAPISTVWKGVFGVGIAIVMILALVNVQTLVGVQFTSDFTDDFQDLDSWSKDEGIYGDINVYSPGKVQLDTSQATDEGLSLQLNTQNTAGQIKEIDFTVRAQVDYPATLSMKVSANGGEDWVTSGHRGNWGNNGKLVFPSDDDEQGILYRTDIPSIYQGNQVTFRFELESDAASTSYIKDIRIDWIPIEEEPNNPPYTCDNPSPSDGASSVLTSRDKLTWTGGDPDGNLDYYKVYFEKGDSTPDNVLGEPSTEEIILPSLDPGSTYYWKVIGYDTSGLSSENRGPIPTWEFTTATADNDPPRQPSNPSPTSGSAVTSTDVTVSWSCTDPDGDSLTYDIYRDGAKKGTVSDPTQIFTFTGLSYGRTYSWKVVARDPHGAQTIGDTWQFTVQRPQYTLTKNTVGQGSISLSPPGGTYESGTTVTATANPGDGWHFDHWDVTTTAVYTEATSRTVTMDSDKTVTAYFEEDPPPPTYVVTINTDPSEGAKTVTGAGEYQEGDTVELSATAASNYQFTGWTIGSQTYNRQEVSFSMPSEDVEVTAHFEKQDKGLPWMWIIVGAIAFIGIAGAAIYIKRRK